MRSIIALLLAGALMAPIAAQEPSLEDWTIGQHRWEGEIASGSGVEIVNPFGDVRVRSTGQDGDAGGVYLVAAIQHHNDDPRRPDFAVDETADGLRLAVRFAESVDGEAAGSADGQAEIPAAWRKRRVDVTVYLPPLARMRAETEKGLIEVKGLRGFVAARTDSGDIEIKAVENLDARTRHGDVKVQFRRTGWSGASHIETLAGSIWVELPRGADAAVDLETRGQITTDYSIEIDRDAGGLLKRGRARIGAADQRLTLKSNRGIIKLLESFVPADRT